MMFTIRHNVHNDWYYIVETGRCTKVHNEVGAYTDNLKAVRRCIEQSIAVSIEPTLSEAQAYIKMIRLLEDA